MTRYRGVGREQQVWGVKCYGRRMGNCKWGGWRRKRGSGMTSEALLMVSRNGVSSFEHWRDSLVEGVGRLDRHSILEAGRLLQGSTGRSVGMAVCGFRHFWDGIHQAKVLLLNIRLRGRKRPLRGQVGNRDKDNSLAPHLAFFTSYNSTCRGVNLLFSF